MATVQRGTDSSGRPIKATAECWAVFDAACAELGFVPTIVQGGWVDSSGAAASADTHAGDAFDIRIWDRTPDERAAMVRAFRRHAFAYWERTQAQGFDPHAHMVPGPWASPAPQALAQWNSYLAGRNGLASNGADTEWRPNPIVTTPPEDDMPFTEKQLNEIIRKAVAEEMTAQLGDLEGVNLDNPGPGKRKKAPLGVLLWNIYQNTRKQ